MINREQILEDYNSRKKYFTQEMISLFDSYPENHRIYAYYVAAYLADCDLRADIAVIKDYIDHGIFLKEAFIKADYSEEIFLNYVLHPRATKEKLDISRSFFFDKVKHLVDFDNQTQTVANLNHWCASHVRYEANDARTKSPLQSYKSGIGRCGESAAFLVHVLRSVGFPARQTFVPWWTHSDSNHAWIDVYVDGEWHYVGDASGEELLDRAWFSLASTRAGLVNASVFSNINDEAILDDHLGVWKTINTTKRYTKTKEVLIKSNLSGLGSVQVSVFNSGSFKTMTHLKIKNNQAKIEFGAGDFFIKAYWNNQLILKKVNEKDSVITISEQDIIREKYYFDQVPREVGLLEQEEETEEIIERKTKNREKSQSQYDEKMRKIKRYGLNQLEYEKLYNALNKTVAQNILDHLAIKDLDDFKADILIEHYHVVKKYKDEYPKDIFNKYLLSPRILWEELNPYAPQFAKQFGPKRKEFVDNPRNIMVFVKNRVSTNTKHHIQNTYMAIDSILDIGIGSYTDQRILAVAIARSLGIPARFNQSLDIIEYYRDDKFHNFEEEQEKFALTIIGDLEQFDVSVEKNEFRHQTNNSKISKDAITVKGKESYFTEYYDKGNYEIISSTRLPNGSIRGVLEIVELNKDMTIHIESPEIQHHEMVENINVQDLIKKLDDTLPQSALIIIGDTRTEPVSHALNETLAQAELLNDMNIPVYIKALNQSEDTSLLSEVKNSMKHCHIINHWDPEREELLVRRVFKEPWDYPFVLLYKNGKSIISSSGYNVGTLRNSWLQDALKI